MSYKKAYLGKLSFIIIIATFVAGCSSMVKRDVPENIGYSDIVSIYGMNCETPYVLEVGCSSTFIANIPFEIDKKTVELASTHDGKILVITNEYSEQFVSSWIEPLTLYSIDPSARELGEAVTLISEKLSDSNIEVLDIRLIGNFENLWGYILITNGNAFGALNTYRQIRE